MGHLRRSQGVTEMTAHALGFWSVALRAMIVHTVTYTAVGWTAFTVFKYGRKIRDDPVRKASMRSPDEPIVRAGILFQPLRGALFGVVFYLLRDVLFAPGGWWVLWLMLVFVGILSTFAPASSSIEGLIYLKPNPTGYLWGGVVEILTQSLLLSLVTFTWVLHPSTWLNWLLGVLFVVALLMPSLGLLSLRGPRRATSDGPVEPTPHRR